MKAVRASIVGEQKVIFEEFDLPDQPVGTQVLIKVDRTVVSAGTELANYIGLDPDTRIPGRWCAYPWRPGYGGIGQVVAAGPDVKTLSVGDRVYGIFNHATYALEDTDNRMLVKVPESLDSTTAIMARMCGVSITGIRRTRTSIGETVVMIGLGLVGNLAAQFFLAQGNRVIGIDFSAKRRAQAESVGVPLTLDPGSLSEDEIAEEIKRFNGGKPAPVIVDAVGDTKIVERSIYMVADNGQVIMLGTPRKVYEGDITDSYKRAHFHGVEIIGALEWTIPLLKKWSPGVTTEANAELILQMMVDGKLTVKPLISHVLPPAELNTAYQGLLHDKDNYLGVVIDWTFGAPPVD
jgi:2-desacetyl-2-hydroxyethyl bacteriochlorophyllide A dehydrogenase